MLFPGGGTGGAAAPENNEPHLKRAKFRLFSGAKKCISSQKKNVSKCASLLRFSRAGVPASAEDIRIETGIAAFGWKVGLLLRQRQNEGSNCAQFKHDCGQWLCFLCTAPMATVTL